MFQFKYRVPVRADRLNGKCAFPAIRTVVTVFAEKHPSKASKTVLLPVAFAPAMVVTSPNFTAKSLIPLKFLRVNSLMLPSCS